MVRICKRCNKEHNDQEKNQLCMRCYDILEFGYPSFMAYPLNESKQQEVELTK